MYLSAPDVTCIAGKIALSRAARAAPAAHEHLDEPGGQVSTLKEADIRPQDLMEGQRIAALTDLGRMLSRRSEFVHVDCPACGMAERTDRFTKNGISYVNCPACRTFYVSPRPSPAVLDWFYSDSPNYAYWNTHIFPASEPARRQHIFRPRVDRLLEICARHGVATQALLEVGAGFGTFCSELKSRKIFKRVVGVEPTPGLAATCRRRDIEVLEKPIEHLTSEEAGEFDVVASFEVIEHLFSPMEFVQHMQRLLRPGGLMMLTCPNGLGFDVETLGPLSSTVDHEHLNYFNPKSLSDMLLRAGMEVLETFTPGKLDAELVRNQVLAGAYSLADQPFLRKVLIDEWEAHGAAFQEFLVARGLSSNLWVVARKAR
jgi:2-polyprenyl-3-methyl-5-hydroxy-6-metoxy-1,4-benzoquinol methylase